MALYKHEDYKFPNKFRQLVRVCRKNTKKSVVPSLTHTWAAARLSRTGI